MNLKIDVNKDRTLAFVSVDLKPRGPKGVKVKILTSDIRRALKKLKYKVGNTVKGCSAHNTSEKTCRGTWIMELIPDKPLTTHVESAMIDDGVGPVKPRKTRRPRRTKKN
jgi:hypothetical protein